ncbi:protein of unknown function [Candidatus Nitrotoga arctica]|uniref:Uncharacterized protein n=1 Tax=Candidatus Nitrotoga arctica TaxID=453162 RepID=A0ABN8AIX5_9PROT|nr:protein of unknown function [Candidatus Nitrotoga arctica]
MHGIVTVKLARDSLPMKDVINFWKLLVLEIMLIQAKKYRINDLKFDASRFVKMNYRSTK